MKWTHDKRRYGIVLPYTGYLKIKSILLLFAYAYNICNVEKKNIKCKIE